MYFNEVNVGLSFLPKFFNMCVHVQWCSLLGLKFKPHHFRHTPELLTTAPLNIQLPPHRGPFCPVTTQHSSHTFTCAWSPSYSSPNSGRKSSRYPQDLWKKGELTELGGVVGAGGGGGRCCWRQLQWAPVKVKVTDREQRDRREFLQEGERFQASAGRKEAEELKMLLRTVQLLVSWSWMCQGEAMRFHFVLVCFLGSKNTVPFRIVGLHFVGQSSGVATVEVNKNRQKFSYSCFL